jgi:hypothetical protein
MIPVCVAAFVRLIYSPACSLRGRGNSSGAPGWTMRGASAGTIGLAEVQFLDPSGPLLDLVGGDQDLADVFVDVAKMLLKFQYAVAQPSEIVAEVEHLGADLVGGVAHPRVFEDLLHHLDCQHQQRGRHQHHAGAIGLLDHVVEAVMDLGVDRFRRHEHQRGVLGLAGNQIFLRDIADVLHHVRAQALGGVFLFLIGACVMQRRHRLQREFGIDAERALVGQEHHAVRPLSGRERELEFVSSLRHAVLDDRLHPRLAEGAARLLVGEHVAQGRHLRGQVGEVLVGVVDDAEPLVQHAQTVHGVARGLFHRLADTVADRVQPLVDGARHLGLTAGQRLGHRVDPAGGFALRAQHFAQALFQFVGPDRLRHRQFRAAPARSRNHDGDRQQQDKGERAEADQRVNRANRPVADHKNNLIHACL